MAEVGDGGFATEFEQLTYLACVDRPEQIRAAGGPWAGVARVVEQASAVLEDGQGRLAEVWRSPAGQLYLAKMGEVAQAMRAVSVAARHNGTVMEAAAEALDARQRDFAVLSTAPIPQEARERYARAIVGALDEDYQQAIADFRPVPPPPDPRIDEPTGTGGSGYTASRRAATFAGGSAAGGGSAGATPRRSPSWVPTAPATAAGPGDPAGSAPAPGGGPQLQGISAGAVPGGGWSGAPGGPGSMPGATPGGSPSATPGAQLPPAAGALPFRPGRAGAGPGGVPPRPVDPRPRAAPQPWPPARQQARAGAGQSGAMLGGLPAGTAGGAGRGAWPGYRRRAEPFPTSQQAAVAPVIDGAPAEETEPELISTDYADEDGNQITIRRPA